MKIELEAASSEMISLQKRIGLLSRKNEDLAGENGECMNIDGVVFEGFWFGLVRFKALGECMFATHQKGGVFSCHQCRVLMIFFSLACVRACLFFATPSALEASPHLSEYLTHRQIFLGVMENQNKNSGLSNKQLAWQRTPTTVTILEA